MRELLKKCFTEKLIGYFQAQVAYETRSDYCERVDFISINYLKCSLCGMLYSHNQTSVSDQLPKGHRLVVAYWTAICLKTQGFSTGNRFKTLACLQQKCIQRELNNNLLHSILLFKTFSTLLQTCHSSKRQKKS